MSLTVASNFARRGRGSKPINPALLSSAGTGAIPQHSCQQIRTYKFGRLSSYFEPYVYARHHSRGYKYCENLYKTSLAEGAKNVVKKVAGNYWSSGRQPSQAAGRFINTDASPKKTPDNPTGIRPGRNIEDVERAPLEHLLFGNKQFQSPRENVKSTQSASDVDSSIDPITNRRVPKVGEQTQTPFFSHGPPTEAELKKYDLDHLWASSEQSPIVNHYGKPDSSFQDTLSWEHKEVRWHRSDAITSASATSAAGYAALRLSKTAQRPEPAIEEYTDLGKYGAFRAHEPDGKYKAQEETVANPEELSKYGAVRAHEPDGKYKDLPEPPANAEELSKYGAVRAHEPDGKYKLASDPPADPEELSKYKPVRSHEPDGKYKEQPETTVDPEELKKYKPVRSHEPDGKYKEQPEETVDPEELKKYGPVRSHEPDGKYKAMGEAEAPVDPKELNKYTAFRSHEPDGKYKREMESAPKNQDLGKHLAMRTHEPTSMFAAAYTDAPDAAEIEFYSQPAELSKYGAFRSHEPDGKYAAAYVQAKPDPKELAGYKAFRSHEPDGKYAAAYVEEKPDAKELSSYARAFRSHEPDGKYAASYVQEKPDASELSKYARAFRSHEPDGKYAAAYVQQKPALSELATYKVFRSHEPDGKYAPTNEPPVKPADTKTSQGPIRSPEPDGKYTAVTDETQDLANHEAFTYEDAETRPLPDEARSSKTTDHAPEKIDPVENVETLAEEKSAFRQQVDELMARAAVESGDVSGASSDDSIKAGSSSGQPQGGLTGNYVRDFPEDFTKSWTAGTTDANLDATLLSSEQKETSSGTVQSALERVTEITSPTTTPPSSSVSSPQEPSIYKVLAWDPTMQRIESAETTSVVADTSAPLSLADILLRISHPAKFFSHFAPLQAQGFEIVAGSGDVLIFRKVRDAVPGSENTSVEDSGAAAGAAVNPIDMTGGNYTVAASRFASPTGFVNYNLPGTSNTDDVQAAPASLRQNTSRTESASAANVKNKKSKISFPKKVAIGAAGLAGSAYSVGVVSEYFRNGGADGKGPKGF
ncbi:uncharacterized protein C8A04DRAFT_11375 [Dichotomopilus funicola]|uniref:Uncharacterized protein n=1 Tax=Dichotomopilus funicola TaxID=1934379 RepID=A0AAN6V4A0_9PEZI|nr:hypothetical protein C8A04DRAFT_11375 [Dichotomopilus funicola]